MSCDFGRVLLDEDQPHVVDVHEQLRDRRTAVQSRQRQMVLRHGPEQVHENGIGPIPRIEQGVEHVAVGNL